MAQKVLRFTQDMAAAREEVARLGGRVIHQFSSVVFVAELPDETDINALTASSEKPTQPLDEISELAVIAWTTAAEEKRSRLEAAPSPTEGLSWDTPGYEPPREFGTPVAEAAWATVDTEDVQKSTGTPTSRYLIGSVAVGIVMVSRNTGAEVLTDAERIKILQEVQEGLDWLAGVEPRAKVSFVYDIRSVTVSSAPGPYAGVTEPYEKFERDWRDAALASMGYDAGRPGYQRYANDLRSSQHTNWAYVAFFTKYPLNHFAYAVVEKVVMSYANDGWGPDDINRVFAHESCHIFGAADEYGPCVCGSVSGHLAVPNKNCVNCFPPGTQIPCLMNANTLAMCEFSRRQIGWDASLFPSSVAWDTPRMIPDWFGWENQGGDIAIADISKNGRADLLVFHIDNPRGENHGYYRIGWNLDNSGIAQSWSPVKAVPGWFGSEDQGAGVALADINGNGTVDLLVFHVDNPGGENHGYYRIGWDINTAGDPVGGWSIVKAVPGWFGSEDQGAGVALADINGNGSQDLIVYHIDNPGGENHGYYRIGWNLNAAGDVTGGWSDIKAIPGWFGSEDQGGGIAIADLNGDGKPELIVFHIDNPGGDNHGYYRIGWSLNASGDVTGGWSDVRIVPGWFGWENQGGGIAVSDIDGNGLKDLVVYHIDNPGRDNHGYYRVGWNLIA